MRLLHYICLVAACFPAFEAPSAGLKLGREKNWLIIKGDVIPAGEIRINYLEAYCRPNSTDADWVKHTMIRHTNELLSLAADGSSMRLRDHLADGVMVDHTIVARDDEVEFRLIAWNPTTTKSEAHWAQPCVRLGDFTGFGTKQTKDDYAYLPKCFVFIEGRLERMPTKIWTTQARYIPGQVWCPADVPRTDINPRPLSPQIPSNGLIGCFSGDEKLIWATAWQPYQELFQGVARCLHSDFRIGGLKPGEKKGIRGKIYIVPNQVATLLRRYQNDFPEHQSR